MPIFHTQSTVVLGQASGHGKKTLPDGSWFARLASSLSSSTWSDIAQMFPRGQEGAFKEGEFEG